MTQNYLENAGIDPFYRPQIFGEENQFEFMNENIARGMLDSGIQSLSINIGVSGNIKVKPKQPEGEGARR